MCHWKCNFCSMTPHVRLIFGLLVSRFLGWSVSVRHYFLKGLEVKLPCSYRSTRLTLSLFTIALLLSHGVNQFNATLYFMSSQIMERDGVRLVAAHCDGRAIALRPTVRLGWDIWDDLGDIASSVSWIWAYRQHMCIICMFAYTHKYTLSYFSVDIKVNVCKFVKDRLLQAVCLVPLRRLRRRDARVCQAKAVHGRGRRRHTNLLGQGMLIFGSIFFKMLSRLYRCKEDKLPYILSPSHPKYDPLVAWLRTTGSFFACAAIMRLH